MWEYGIVDGQYLLVRGFHQQSKDYWVYSTNGTDYYWDKELTNKADLTGFIKLESDGMEDGVPYYKLKSYINESLLSKSFIQSVMKLKRDFPHKYTILCWDKSPYYKSQVINEYKQDRYRPTEEQVADLQTKLQDPTITDEEKVTIRNQITEMEVDMTNFQSMQKVKYYIIFELNNCGWNSCIKSGFEADDLAHFIADEYNRNHTENKSVLLATDKDWLHFINDWVEFKSIKYPDKDYSYIIDPATDAIDKYNLPRYDYGILSEIYGGSHNNVTGLGEIEWDDFIRRYWVEHDNTMPKYDDVDAYYNAMQVDKYVDEVKPLLNYILHNWSVINNKMKTFCQVNSIRLNLSTYNDFISNIDKIESSEPLNMKSLLYGELTKYEC